MKKPLIKICGITNRSDAETAVSLGADALGFVFYLKSARYISPDNAQIICESVPGNILKIAVIVNAEQNYLTMLREKSFLDYYQLHGDETPDMCSKFEGRAIKAFRVGDSFDSSIVNDYSECAMFLFDTKRKGLYGGSGESFNWNALSGVPRTHPFVLAGGLSADNVAEAIRTVDPYMVDVSTAVESQPGKKDARKIERFIAACHSK